MSTAISLTILTVWLTGTGTCAVIFGFVWAFFRAMEPEAKDVHKKNAKLFLLSWAWPAIIVYILCLLIRDAAGKEG